MNKLLGIELNLKAPLKPQIQMGAALFQKRTCQWPDIILVHPDLVITEPIDDLGIEVHREKFVQPHLAYIGTAECEDAVGEPA